MNLQARKPFLAKRVSTPSQKLCRQNHTLPGAVLPAVFGMDSSQVLSGGGGCAENDYFRALCDHLLVAEGGCTPMFTNFITTS
jgi:hypothetical protein